MPDLVAELALAGFGSENALEAIWSLVSDGKLELTPDRHVRTFVDLQPPIKTRDGRGPSGIHPIGPGDTLYNADGEAVAIVKDMGTDFERTPNGNRRIITVDLKLLFDHVYSSRDGTSMINENGTILGGTASTCMTNHDLLIRKSAELSKKEVECPECRLWMRVPGTKRRWNTW